MVMNAIFIAAAIAAIIGLYFQFVDHWNHIKKLARWFQAQITRMKADRTPVVLDIPPGPPPTELPADGKTKTIVSYILYGSDRLLAYEVTRDGFPGVRYLVERHRPNQQPAYCDTPDRERANEQWRTWYQEWQSQPGGFGGSSGTGLDGRPPWNGQEYMTSAVLNGDQINCLYGSLRRLLQDQRSGIIRSIAGDAGFDLGRIRSGLRNGMIQRAPILADIDQQWGALHIEQQRELLPRFADALLREAKDEVNIRIAKCGFRFENGQFVRT